MVIRIIKDQNMASLICFGLKPLPPKLVGFPSLSRAIAQRRTKTQFSLIQTSHLLPYNKCRSPNHAFATKVFASDMSSVPSGKEGKDKSIGKCVARASIILASFVLACVLGVMVGGDLRIRRTAVAGPRELYQKAPQVVAYPLSGKDAIKSLLDVTTALTSSEIEPPLANFQLPPRPSMEDVNDIKMHAIQIMRFGKAEDAVNFLQYAYGYYRNDPEPAYYVEMALVEILLSLGKYKKALERNCLNDSYRLPSDGRFPLYKAIIYTMLDDKEEAKRWWGEYVEAIEGGFNPTQF